MKPNKPARELIDRYLLAVKRELTGKQRDDIAAEIESYILDSLDERFSGEKDFTKAQTEDILTEMGAPRKVAAQYSPQRSLIGPRLFPIYFLVLKIIVAVVTGALTLSFIITSILGEPSNVWLSILEFFGTIWSGALSAAGAITLVFAIIESAAEGKEIEEIDEMQKLNIPDLPELPEEEEKFSKIGTSIEIVLGIIGIAFFTYINSTGGYVPFFANPDSDMQVLPLFTENFLPYIPLIIAFAGLDLTCNLILLIQKHHSALTIWWQICTQAANVFMMGFLIKSLPLITLEGFRSIDGLDLDFTHLGSLANTGIAIGIGLGIFGTIVDILRKVIREIRNPTK